SFNDGINKIQSAQGVYPEFCRAPASDADKAAKAEAEKNFRDAQASLTKALSLKPGDVQTTRNLASVYAMTCDSSKAEATLRDGLKAAPNDTALTAALHMVRVNVANQLAEDKKYDEAIKAYEELAKDEPNNSDSWLSIADVYFRRAQGLQG